MKKDYKTPQIEVIEIEAEGALCASVTSSGVYATDVYDDGDAW